MSEPDRSRNLVYGEPIPEKNDLIPDESEWPPNLPEPIKEELRLRQRLQKYFHDIAVDLENGGTITVEEVAAKVNEMSGSEYGMPLPSLHDLNTRMILAHGVPLSRISLNYRTESEERLAGEKVKVRNSWGVLGDMDVCVIETEVGPMALPSYHAGARMRILFETMMTRSGMAIRADAELRAMDSLKKRIGSRQWDSYVLNGCFPEKSNRSDLHYFFRKGFPTVVLSYHGEASAEGHIIACLCLHPMGYYQGTFCGLMTPTDEVICHLLMMRGDERKYWAKCGQWRAADPRSGL